MELLSLCLLVVGSSITLKKKQKKPRWEVKDSTKIHLENFLARIYSQLHPKKKKFPCFLLPIIVLTLKPVPSTSQG
jgi:hypothetical protein